jgi:hypothetical protein
MKHGYFQLKMSEVPRAVIVASIPCIVGVLTRGASSTAIDHSKGGVVQASENWLSIVVGMIRSNLLHGKRFYFFWT